MLWCHAYSNRKIMGNTRGNYLYFTYMLIRSSTSSPEPLMKHTHTHLIPIITSARGVTANGSVCACQLRCWRTSNAPPTVHYVVCGLAAGSMLCESPRMPSLSSLCSSFSMLSTSSSLSMLSASSSFSMPSTSSSLSMLLTSS